MRTLVIGDIHGGYRSMMQCFERSKFNYDTDRLIVLGDVCDGWDETKEVIDEMLKIKNLIFVIGNHDIWALDWMEDESHCPDNMLWVNQGGMATIKSYLGDKRILSHWKEYQNHADIPDSHKDFLKNKALLWHEEDGKLFVHGGIAIGTKVNDNKPQSILWDRELFAHALTLKKSGMELPLTQYKEVWIGHTSTMIYNESAPVMACEVINIDTGGGYEGKLSIMDLDTKEYWQSDLVIDLYPNYYFVDASYKVDSTIKECVYCSHAIIHKDGLCRTCWEAEEMNKLQI